MLDLSTLFDYDLWATRRWLLALPKIADLARTHEVLEHMLYAHRIWLERLGHEAPPAGGAIPMQAVFEEMSRAWKRIVEEAPLDAEVEYSARDGQRFSNTIREIAQHVVNHGTYHRGQLRGLAEAEGFMGFPETDLIAYLRENGD